MQNLTFQVIVVLAMSVHVTLPDEADVQINDGPENVQKEPITLLSTDDFPKEFVNFTHPNDYSLRRTPLPPEFIYHRSGKSNRLILRISWRSGESYIPMSFVVDTGCTAGFELSEKAHFILKQHKLLRKGEDFEYAYVHFGSSETGAPQTCQKFKSKVVLASENITPANVIGLRTLTRTGLMIHDKDAGFHFIQNISWF